MTRTILGTGAVLAAAVALAGCGGGGSNASGTAGTTVGTAGGVAGVQKTRGGLSFNAQVNGMQKQLAAAVKQLQRGNVAGAANVGGRLLTNCQNTVTKKLAPRAKTTAQQTALSHVRTACDDISNASTKAAAGDMSSAKQLAQQALAEMTAAKNALKGSS